MVLEELIGSILEIPPTDLTNETGPQTVAVWDSFAHINIITALEEVYGVTLSTDEITSLKSLGDARKVLRAKGVEV